MKKYRPMPTQESLKALYHYDPETGIFTRAVSRRRWKAGSECGTLAGGYISINVDGTVYRAHRLAWVYMTGLEPKLDIDHINGIRTDNRWANLREANPSQNAINTPKRKNNRCGLKGVSFDSRRGLYRARIQKEHKGHWLGYFSSAAAAHEAYSAAAMVAFGPFAHQRALAEEPERK